MTDPFIENEDHSNYFQNNQEKIILQITLSKDNQTYTENIDLNQDFDEITKQLSEKYSIDPDEVREVIEAKILQLNELNEPLEEQSRTPRLDMSSVRSEIMIIHNSNLPSNNNSSIKVDKSSTSTSKHYNSSKYSIVKKKSIGLSNSQ
jgi:hypothetical protein